MPSIIALVAKTRNLLYSTTASRTKTDPVKHCWLRLAKEKHTTGERMQVPHARPSHADDPASLNASPFLRLTRPFTG